MKRTELTSEWLGNWKPTRITEIADRGCRGLVVRGGPSGTRTFYRWTDVRDVATGKAKRQRVKLGHWPALSLGEARKAVNDARETKGREVVGADLTVADLARAYQRDRLSSQEHGAERWNVIRVHVVEARPDPKRPPFGDWPARSVVRADLAAVVRAAKVERLVERPDGGRRGSRWQGGPGTARTVLADVNAIFAHGVDAGLLTTNPAGMKAGTFGLQTAGRARYLDATEIAALFAALDLTALLDGMADERKVSTTVRLGIAFQAYTPPRSQGIIGARWEEVDLDGATWVIPPARQKVKNAAARAQLRAFTVPLAPTAVAILRRLRALWPGSPWVLPSPLDPARPLSPKALTRALRRLQGSGRLAFQTGATVHDLRRTWRTLAGDLGVAFEVAEACLGHKLGGVAGVYARGDMVERRREATELVGAALDRIRLGKAAAVVPMRRGA
jgi:integrase